jgi:glycolate oxidase FAD binding subunit
MCTAARCRTPICRDSEGAMGAGGEEAILGELTERIRAAALAQQGLRLKGSGSKDFYGESLAGEVLELGAFRGIVDYEPSELVITARCGTPLSELEAALGTHHQFLAFEPPAFGAATTLGGVIAAGLSGPRRPYAGAARDFVLGTRLLTAQGEHLRFGGQVMKNVAGFDVSRLLCGSLGILGVITEVSLKVMPRPRLEETLRLELPATEAVEAFNRWAALPLPLSGAAWWQASAWLRLSGAPPAVRAACERIGGEKLPAAEAETFWDDVRHCRLAIFASDSLWRLSVPAATARLPLPGEPLIDWGGAVRWYANLPAETPVREIALAAGGTALGWRGANTGGRFHPLTPAVADLHRRLKERFDPAGIFNPGRLLAGI